ncbi:MAG: helix-turn-helix domain-containing protein [Flavobacteriales bacterium]|nr:helix-turn-helix domain-containing protein [Flavobacteriales bacterium]
MNQITFVSITPEELKRLIRETLRTEIESQAAAPPPLAEELISRKEAAQMLGITLPTLRLYTKRGLLNGYRIGARVRYKRSEVLASVQAMRFSAKAR